MLEIAAIDVENVCITRTPLPLEADVSASKASRCARVKRANPVAVIRPGTAVVLARHKLDAGTAEFLAVALNSLVASVAVLLKVVQTVCLPQGPEPENMGLQTAA